MFIEFLNLTGLWSRWLESCPLAYSSPNAPGKAEVLGTWMLSILAGHRRYSHVTTIRYGGVNPGLLGTATGYGMARWLCATVFERSIGFNWWLAVVSVVFSALVAVVASIPPVHRATRIDPAVVLREE